MKSLCNQTWLVLCLLIMNVKGLAASVFVCPVYLYSDLNINLKVHYVEKGKIFIGSYFVP